SIAASILLYKSLAGRGGRAALISQTTARRLVPSLRSDDLRMCGVFEEAETIDARLVLATVKGAAKAGALVLNHARVTGLDLRHNRGGAVAIHAGDDGPMEVHARHVINAAGPWVDHVRRLDEPAAAPLVRLSKGIHLLLPLEDEWKAGVGLPLGDGRVSLGIPWQGMLMLGTTDTLFTGDPSRVEVTRPDAGGRRQATPGPADRVARAEPRARRQAGASRAGLEPPAGYWLEPAHRRRRPRLPRGRSHRAPVRR